MQIAPCTGQVDAIAHDGQSGQWARIIAIFHDWQGAVGQASRSCGMAKIDDKQAIVGIVNERVVACQFNSPHVHSQPI